MARLTDIPGETSTQQKQQPSLKPCPDLFLFISDPLWSDSVF